MWYRPPRAWLTFSRIPPENFEHLTQAATGATSRPAAESAAGESDTRSSTPTVEASAATLEKISSAILSESNHPMFNPDLKVAGEATSRWSMRRMIGSN